MICLRCGYCCKNLFVTIIKNPDLVKTEEDFFSDNIMENMETMVGDGTPCRHLKGKRPGEYSCKIHNYPWYQHTPCASYTQIEHGNTNCRMGEYILKRRKKNVVHH